jgi:hypothetical protein
MTTFYLPGSLPPGGCTSAGKRYLFKKNSEKRFMRDPQGIGLFSYDAEIVSSLHHVRLLPLPLTGRPRSGLVTKKLAAPYACEALR